MTAPASTYRLQLNRDFPLEAARDAAPYLARLGVTHIYLSPVTTARRGSTHGYDVVDPRAVNPELGGEADLDRLSARAHDLGLKILLDIVPNHMAVGEADNAYWLDVLQHGEESRWRDLFDIDWRPADPALRGKILAPFLGRSYGEALAGGDVRLSRLPDGRLAAVAHEAHAFPLAPADQARLAAADETALAAAYDPASETGRNALHELLERQSFRLASWRTAGDEINWRRFFDVTTLAGVRVEDEGVFETTHDLVFRLFEADLIQGVRVDHVDGLADPAGYCRRLRARLADLAARRGAEAEPPLLLVEKILAPFERLNPAWETDGTTGYDYMEEAGALLHDPGAAELLAKRWASLSGRASTFHEEALLARREILAWSFEGQLEAASSAFHRLARSRLDTRDLTRGEIRRSLHALLSVFPCYRTYAAGSLPDPQDGERLELALEAARPLAAPGEGEVLETLRSFVLAAPWGEAVQGPEVSSVRRLQQLSAPLAAKAIEDTAFYRYGRLLSRNEVGGDPDRFALSPAEAHARFTERARATPQALNATATHDHKRGEDVRARLAAVSEAPSAFAREAARFAEAAAAVTPDLAPGDVDMIFQTLVGAFPLEALPLSGEDGRPAPAAEAALSGFAERAGGWLVKALREAKLRTAWTAPDEGYERSGEDLIRRALDPASGGALFEAVLGTAAALAVPGAQKGLVSAVLKCLAPGAPDIYQGCEFWDFSLVDPDNRRAVDFGARSSGLEAGGDLESLLRGWRDGRVKQRLVGDALQLRKNRPAAFRDYRPLDVDGPDRDDLLAFLREGPDGAVAAILPIRTRGRLAGVARPAFHAGDFAGTTLRLPAAFEGARLAGVPVRDGRLELDPVLTDRPLAFGVLEL